MGHLEDDTSTQFGPRYDQQDTAGRRVYPIDERPDVEVLIDDVWRPGVLRMWAQDADTGEWIAHVEYSAGSGRNHLDKVASDRVKLAAAPSTE